MLFKVRGVQPMKQERPKSYMTIADILSFRDTWTDIPSQRFSVLGILERARKEKLKKAEVPKLVMTDNGFRVRDKECMGDSELELRRVQSTLNKLTEDNFDAVAQEMLSHELIFDPVVLSGSVNIIFTKAVAEPVFSGLYARLCARIANYEKELINVAKENPTSALAQTVEAAEQRLKSLDPMERPNYGNIGDFVRVALILRCQKFHEQFVQQTQDIDEEAQERLRKQNMANIKFVAELYMKSLVTNSVVVIICSTALALGYDASLPKTTVTNVEVEMVINLMNVLGKKFDESNDPKTAPCRDEIWAALKKCADDKRFSMRIRFLLQNLFEWRASGWKPKETTKIITTAAASSSNNIGDGNTTHNANSTSGGGSSSSATSHTRRGYNSADSYVDSSAGHYTSPVDASMPSSASHAFHSSGAARHRPHPTSSVSAAAAAGPSHALPATAVPRFSSSALPPPPFGSGNTLHAALSESSSSSPRIRPVDRIRIAQAQPPSALSAEVQSRLLSAARDAATDGEEDGWSSAKEQMAEAMSDLPSGDTAAARWGGAVYALTKWVTQTNVNADRAIFTKTLNSGIFDVAALCDGYAWCLSDAIANNLNEDYPLLFSRFAAVVVDTAALSLTAVLRDILARTANYLDALELVTESDSACWDENFIEVCAGFLTLWAKKRRGGPGEESALALLDSVASVEQGQFLALVISDFIMELVQQEFVTEQDVASWLATHGSDESLQTFAEELEELFPSSNA